MAKKPTPQTLKDLKPQGETPPTSGGTAGGTHTEQPEMAAKKDWSQLFAKGVKHDQEVPAVQRTGRSLPFAFDSMKLNSMHPTVTPEFWQQFGGLTKTQAMDPQRNKEAIRRSFYGWRDKDPKRKDLAVAFSDQYEGKGSERVYTGVNFYLTKSTGQVGKKKAA